MSRSPFLGSLPDDPDPGEPPFRPLLAGAVAGLATLMGGIVAVSVVMHGLGLEGPLSVRFAADEVPVYQAAPRPSPNLAIEATANGSPPALLSASDAPPSEVDGARPSPISIPAPSPSPARAQRPRPTAAPDLTPAPTRAPAAQPTVTPAEEVTPASTPEPVPGPTPRPEPIAVATAAPQMTPTPTRAPAPQPTVKPAEDVSPGSTPQPIPGPTLEPLLELPLEPSVPQGIVAPRPPENMIPESVRVPTLDGLPAYRLSTPTGFERDRTGRVHWERATYATYDGAQVVRQHYRSVMRARGWEVTGNEVLADGVVLLTASRDRVEATIRIVQLGNASVITVLVSEITVSREPRAPEPQVPDPDRVIIQRVSAREPDRLERQPRTRPQVSGSGSGSGVRPAGSDTRDDPPRDDGGGGDDHHDPSKPDKAPKPAKGEKDDDKDRPSKPDHQDPDRDKAPKPEKDKSSKDKGERDDRHSPPGHREHDRGKPPKPAKAKHEPNVRHVKPSQKHDGGDHSPKHSKGRKHGDKD